MIEDVDREIYLRMEKFQKKAIKDRDKARLRRLKKGSPDSIYEDGYQTGRVSTIGLMMLLFAQMKMEHEQKFLLDQKELDRIESNLS